MAIKYSSHEYRDHLQEVGIMMMKRAFHRVEHLALCEGCVWFCAFRRSRHGRRLPVWSSRGSCCCLGWKILRGRHLTPADFSSKVEEAQGFEIINAFVTTHYVYSIMQCIALCVINHFCSLVLMNTHVQVILVRLLLEWKRQIAEKSSAQKFQLLITNCLKSSATSRPVSMTTSHIRWGFQLTASVRLLSKKPRFYPIYNCVTGSTVQRKDALGSYWDAVLATTGETCSVAGEICTDSFTCEAASSESQPGILLF